MVKEKNRAKGVCLDEIRMWIVRVENRYTAM